MGITKIFLLLLVIGYSNSVIADDIVVLDSQALTRLHVSNKEILAIEVTTKCDLLAVNPLEVILLREDGLGNEIVATSVGGCKYVAQGLVPGRWRIKAEQNGVKSPIINVSVIN